MKLVVGLGNPGDNYRNNRHNVGHMAVDALLKRNLPKNSVVRKTSVFMNESGPEVKKMLGGLNPNNLYIIHDDLDIALGGYKIQKGKGPKLHKGILSIERQLGTSDFWRVRIGVDNRIGDKTPGEEYVLQDFTEEEKEILKEVINKVAREILSL